MKISTLMEKLDAIKDHVGDVEVFITLSGEFEIPQVTVLPFYLDDKYCFPAYYRATREGTVFVSL